MDDIKDCKAVDQFLKKTNMSLEEAASYFKKKFAQMPLELK